MRLLGVNTGEGVLRDSTLNHSLRSTVLVEVIQHCRLVAVARLAAKR